MESLSKRYKGVNNLGVKQAPFFVLLGASMPSVLIETSFISNRQEERRLKNNQYLDRIAEGITEGIISYATNTQLARNVRDR
jgi:N-acetylmuramoyl-L-alanine amidase